MAPLLLTILKNIILLFLVYTMGGQLCILFCNLQKGEKVKLPMTWPIIYVVLYSVLDYFCV